MKNPLNAQVEWSNGVYGRLEYVLINPATSTVTYLVRRVGHLWGQLADTDKATDNVEEIVAAAVNGRVDKLIVSVEHQIWGAFNPKDGKVTRSSNGQSKKHNLALLDFTAMNTLQNGGTVCALSQDEMPTDSPIAAVFRY